MPLTNSYCASCGMRTILLAAAVLTASTVTTEATTQFSSWDGGSGDWDTHVLNWDDGHKWVNNSSALFGGTAGTVTLQEAIRSKNIRFSSSGYTVAGSFQLDIKDGLVLDAGVSSATISAPMLLTKAQSWSIVDAGAMLTVSSIDLDNMAWEITGAGDLTLTTRIGGVGSLLKTGTGTLQLTVAESHTGIISVLNGTLAVLGNITKSETVVERSGRLLGNGVLGKLTVGKGGTLSPGLSIGILTAGNVVWQGGGYYNWQIADATGVPGTGFDQLVSTGTLTVDSTTLDRFKINLWSLAGAVNGVPANFDPELSYAWDIATFTSIAGFDPTRFLIVRGPSEGTGGFIGALDGTFSLSSDGTHLTLQYTPGSPVAGPVVWTDGTGLWSEGANWLAGTTPTVEAQPIFFAGTGGTSTHDTALASASEIRFLAEASGSYVVDGASLTIGSGGVINESAYTQTVAMNLVLATNSILVTHTATLVVTGDIDTAGHALVVDGDHDTQIDGDILGSGALYKLDYGRLTLSGANTFTGGTDAAVGELIVNGSLRGPVLIHDLALLGGIGSLHGSVAVGGVLSPGASPGVLTQAIGDTTLLTGSTFMAELGGVTPGAGDGYHDQYDILNGRCVIQVDVTLDVLGWDDALGADYLPKRGDVFTIIRTSAGIVDVFDDLTNLERAGRVLFDNNTNHAHLYGNLYGTGLTGAQTLAAYAANSNQASFAAALDRAAITASASSTADHPAGFIDSDQVEGRVVLALLKGESLDPYSPEAYLGVTDYALTSLRAAADGSLARQTRSLPGTWTFSFAQGYVANVRTGGSSAAFDRDVSASNSVLGATCDLGPATTIGFFLGHNDGKFSTRHSRTDLSGSVHGASLVQRLNTSRPTVLKACIAWADLDFTTVRQMNLGDSGDSEIVLSSASSVARNVPLTAFSLQVTADIQLAQSSGYELNVVAGFVRGRSTLGAFTEAGSGANLTVAVQPEETSLGILGLSSIFVYSLETSFSLTAALEREMGDPATRLGASIAGEDFDIMNSSTSRHTGLLGFAFTQQYAYQTSLQFTAELRFNKDARNDQRLNLSIAKRF